MINSQTETLLTLSEAADSLPRRRAGRKCNKSTIYRWTSRGCRGVVLESVQIGATRCTSVEALRRFYARLTTAGRDGTANVLDAETPSSHVRNNAVDKELDRLGLG